MINFGHLDSYIIVFMQRALWYDCFMSRNVEFNTDRALKAATKVFWSQGYKKASVQSLMKAMKIGESSFYNTFKSKKNLYLLCLDSYNKVVTAKRLEILKSEGTIKKRFNEFFEEILDDQERKMKSKGCMMTNSLSYEVLSDKDLRKYVEDQMLLFGEVLESLVSKGIESGELNKDIDAKSTSKLVIIYLQGLFKISLIEKDFKKIKEDTRYFLTSLGF